MYCYVGVVVTSTSLAGGTETVLTERLGKTTLNTSRWILTAHSVKWVTGVLQIGWFAETLNVSISTKRRIIDGKFTNNCRHRFNGRYVWSIKLTWFTEHDEFKMLFVSFISRSFIEDISSRGRMPQIKTLIALFPCLKQLAILIRPFTIFSGESVEVLELLHIFAQAYEEVYARNLHIKWKHRDLYSRIIPITGGFHQMRVFQTVPSNATTAGIYKIGLLIPEQLLPQQLVKRLKGDIIIVQYNYIKKDLILLSRGE